MNRTSRNGSRWNAVLFALVIAAQCCAFADGAEAGSTNDLAGPSRLWAATVRWENDTFGGTDRFYTDGVSLGLTHTGPSWLDPVADWLPWGKGRRTVSYDAAQVMITPWDTRRPNPDPKDRPYAGILSAGLALHIERSNSYHGLKFITGVVGPWSLAEETQRLIHDILGNGVPRGWAYQLENEPILNMAYEYRYRLPIVGRRDGWALEAFPVAGGWLGNLLIEGEFGGLLRAGYNIPKDFGPTLVRGMGLLPPPRHDPEAGSDWGFGIYAGALANLVVRDLTLDGNTFETSRSVDKNFFVPVGTVGVSAGNRHFLFTFSYVLWGREFKGQAEYSQFGALSFTYIGL